MSLPIILLAFILCATLIVIDGSKLSKYGDIIAELTGMGKAWFGLILMAAVTSLPELFTGFSSIVLIHSPDIAVGDIMGSCAFNLFILACLDFYVPQILIFLSNKRAFACRPAPIKIQISTVTDKCHYGY